MNVRLNDTYGLALQPDWRNPVPHTLVFGDYGSRTADSLRRNLDADRNRVVIRDDVREGVDFFMPGHCHLVVIDRTVPASDAIYIVQTIRGGYGSHVPIMAPVSYSAEHTARLHDLGATVPDGKKNTTAIAEGLIGFL
tara:strand:- start:259 stop:672 length:414 start_codon:yes stop_codon:yes gene_type:complete